MKVLPYLQCEDIIIDAGNVEALGDRLVKVPNIQGWRSSRMGSGFSVPWN
jgi:hypothetical protein